MLLSLGRGRRADVALAGAAQAVPEASNQR
jgi:hypothetical protein